ncbi:uncharacterized protein LOC110368872 isoform X2 [Fundulus heteroclitus]|uniref:uncharacterized protein LOC110368872 isoform X2 n=1 Tax=Fundulus heteroclitus TaxID=8078 RepID=UPI00165CE5ED|nr:uncharacterized protein LOC110368872 isoform X2 [Fundulus heteroclitus]
MLWTNCITGQQNKTQALANWCIANECIFTGKRNSSKTGWDDFVRASGLEVTAKQAKKKWHNLVQKYKDKKAGLPVWLGGSFQTSPRLQPLDDKSSGSTSSSTSTWSPASTNVVEGAAGGDDFGGIRRADLQRLKEDRAPPCLQTTKGGTIRT